jgi:hypothetical protein
VRVPSLRVCLLPLTGTPARVLAGVRLADYARLEASSEHKDVFYLGPAGSGPRSFFLDADLAVTTRVRSWLELVRSKWRGVMNESDPTAISVTITGTPKVRVLFRCAHHLCVSDQPKMRRRESRFC